MPILRFSLRDKATLRPLKLYFNIAEVAAEKGYSGWCCSVLIA